jgi:beta-phosphoglucomutase-like phosphatase (HAD superfamily)
MFGIIFDLDGTLVDSDPIHFEAWQKKFAEVDANAPLIDREFFDRHISGRIKINLLIWCFCMIYLSRPIKC